MDILLVFKVKLDNLQMEPRDWSILNHELSNGEYVKVVNDYQRRKEMRLPTCGHLFGVCRYFVRGRCNCKHYCELKGRIGHL